MIHKSYVLSGQTNLYRAKPENNHSFELTACDFLQRKKLNKEMR